MKYIQTFGKDQIGFKDMVVNLGKRLIESWSGYSLLLESVQEAKTIVDQLIQAKLDENPDASQEEKDRIANRFRNQFEAIRRVFQNNPGYMPAMVRFHFLHGIKIESLNQLLELITKNKDSLDELSMTVDEYSRLKPVKDESGNPPYERMTDEFNRITELRGGNWIVKALPRNALSQQIAGGIIANRQPVDLKEEYRKAPQEVKNRLREAGARLTRLNKPGYIMSMRKSLSGLSSIDAVIDAANKTYDAATSNVGELVDKAYAAYPSVSVLYFDGTYAVFSFRNDSQLPTLCSGAVSWCIQPAWYNPGYAEQFWSYASGTVQLGILDFSVPSDNSFRTVGVTINPSGSVRSLCDQMDKCTSGGNYLTLLSNFTTVSDSHSYPPQVISGIQDAFDSEVRIKKITDPIYSKLRAASRNERDRTAAAIKTVEYLVKNISEFESLANTQAEQKDRDLANLVIASELRSFGNTEQADEIQKHFKNSYSNGILISPASVTVIDAVLGGSKYMTPEFLETLIKRTKTMSDQLRAKVRSVPATNRSQNFERIAEFIEKKLSTIDLAIAAATELKEKIKGTS